MKMFRTVLFALATLAVVPALALAHQAQGGTPQKSPTTTTPKAAVRAVAGVVKSVDANSLVITAAGKEKAQELTFVLNAATQKKGTIAAGARVSVRYQVEGGKNVASAVTVEQKGK